MFIPKIHIVFILTLHTHTTGTGPREEDRDSRCDACWDTTRTPDVFMADLPNNEQGCWPCRPVEDGGYGSSPTGCELCYQEGIFELYIPRDERDCWPCDPMNPTYTGCLSCNTQAELEICGSLNHVRLYDPALIQNVPIVPYTSHLDCGPFLKNSV